MFTISVPSFQDLSKFTFKVAKQTSSAACNNLTQVFTLIVKGLRHYVTASFIFISQLQFSQQLLQLKLVQISICVKKVLVLDFLTENFKRNGTVLYVNLVSVIVSYVLPRDL